MKKESQIGVDCLPDGVAIARVQARNSNLGDNICSVYVGAAGQVEQAVAPKEWVGI